MDHLPKHLPEFLSFSGHGLLKSRIHGVLSGRHCGSHRHEEPLRLGEVVPAVGQANKIGLMCAMNGQQVGCTMFQ